MSRLQIRLPDELATRLASRARESGFDTIEAYVEALLRADATEDEFIDDAELEQLLLQRLDSGPGIECTPAFVAQFKEQVSQRRRDRDRGARQ